jgi:hypothetical protein
MDPFSHLPHFAYISSRKNPVPLGVWSNTPAFGIQGWG